MDIVLFGMLRRNGWVAVYFGQQFAGSGCMTKTDALASAKKSKRHRSTRYGVSQIRLGVWFGSAMSVATTVQEGEKVKLMDFAFDLLWFTVICCVTMDLAVSEPQKYPEPSYSVLMVHAVPLLCVVYSISTTGRFSSTLPTAVRCGSQGMTREGLNARLQVVPFPVPVRDGCGLDDRCAD